MIKSTLKGILELWKTSASMPTLDLTHILDFEVSEIKMIFEWLHRLSMTKDFKDYQRELAERCFAI